MIVALLIDRCILNGNQLEKGKEMKIAKYERDGNRITNLETGASVAVPHQEAFPPSINAAKKVSRELQQSGGMLGDGRLRAI